MPKYHLDADALRHAVAERLVGLSMIAKTKRIAWFYSLLSMNYLNHGGPVHETGKVVVFGSRSDCITAYNKTAKRRLGRKTCYRYFDLLQTAGLISVQEDGRVVLDLPIQPTVTEIHNGEAREGMAVRPADVRATAHRSRPVVGEGLPDVAGRIVAG